ncbi:MAG: ABC transporter substrate-binding protein [Proteobacteria bacterium]|nr:ABC transporter substrate-binding protein [Pseudomonadota bacterium]MDA1057435.1 ABC transporter substrate-binding protein [Pseudomonadota bacterium]
MAARRFLALAILIAGVGVVAPSHVRADPPTRVVSINLCADQLLAFLADPGVLLSVTHLSTDPSLSYVAEQVRDIPINYGRSEEVLTLRPDLVVAGLYAARPAVAMLQKFGIEVIDLPIPETFHEIRRQVRLLSERLGVEPRGQLLIAEMDRRLANVAANHEHMPRALVLGARGFTSGPGTLVHEVLTAAGLRNVAAELGVQGYGQVGLEEIVRADPEIIVVNQPSIQSPSLARDVLAHPALRLLGGQVVRMNPSLWGCGGPHTVEAVEFLAAVAR